MKVKLISWNIRGLNDMSKRNTIKSLIQKWRPDILCLQETKTELFSVAIARELWGSRWVEWVELKASGTREEVLLFYGIEAFGIALIQSKGNILSRLC